MWREYASSIPCFAFLISGSSSPDPIQDIIGAWGMYQLWLFIIIGLSKFEIVWNQLSIIFLAPKIGSHTCPGSDTLCPCDNPEWDDNRLFKNTITTEFKLICNKKWLENLAQALFQTGTLLGSVFFGMAADRFGRKWPITAAVYFQFLAGMISSYMPNYESFVFLRFIVGLTVGGTMVIGFVIVMEFTGARHREVVAALYQLPFNIGHMILPFIGKMTTHSFRSFQRAVALPGAFLLTYACLVPETPRWLVAMKKNVEAAKLLEHVAKFNKRSTANIQAIVDAHELELSRHTLKKGTILDLFRTPNMRKNIIVISYNWLTCSYCFYGISQFVGQLSGDIFMNVFAGATVTAMGTIGSIPLLKVLGRKQILILMNGICALCCFLIPVLPTGTRIICASIGKISSFINFCIVYLYTSELFPTVVRNAAMGFSSMWARVGSMIAPFVLLTGNKAAWMPPVIFGIVPLIGVFITVVLPETKGCQLMTTLEEGENFGKKSPTNVATAK